MNSKSLYVKQLGTIPPPYGGVSVHVKRLTFSLIKRGFRAGAFSYGAPTGVPDMYIEHFDTHQPPHFNSYKALVCFHRILQAFSDCRLIHSHTSINTSFTLLLLHKILKIPIVITIHNQMIDREYGQMNSLDKWSFKHLAKDSDVQIIAVNDIEKRLLEEKPVIFANPIRVIPAYIPPVEIGVPQDYLSAQLVSFTEQKGKCILFYAESFANYNNEDIYGTSTIIDLFIILRSEIQDLSLVFCIANGSNHTHTIEDLKCKVKDKGLQDDVYWQIGAIPEMWPLLKNCDLYIRPTNTDGDSVLVREALAYGMPVVASDVTNRPKGCYVYRFGDCNDLYLKSKQALDDYTRTIVPQIDYSDELILIYQNLIGNK